MDADEGRRRFPSVPGYELVREVGRGGFATVYEARQLSVDRPVALKVVSTGTLSPVTERRFRDELRAVGGLSWHPHVVAVHDGGLTEDGRPFLCMELLTGGSWGARVRAEGPLPPGRVARLGAEVADALHAAHQSGVVHRDVKPDNVLVGRRDEALLTDFGIATLADATMTATGTFVGTIAYSPPELLRGERATPRSDVYALGALLWTFAVGAPAFDTTQDETPVASVYRVLTDPPPDLPADVPAPLAAVIARCMAREPEDRYPSALAAQGALALLSEPSRAGASPPTPSPIDATVVGPSASSSPSSSGPGPSSGSSGSVEGPDLSLPPAAGASPPAPGLGPSAGPADEAATAVAPVAASAASAASAAATESAPAVVGALPPAAPGPSLAKPEPAGAGPTDPTRIGPSPSAAHPSPSAGPFVVPDAPPPAGPAPVPPVGPVDGPPPPGPWAPPPGSWGAPPPPDPWGVPPAPAWGPPPAPGPQWGAWSPPPKTSGLAIAGLVVSLLSCFPVGLALTIAGHVQVRRGTRTGKVVVWFGYGAAVLVLLGSVALFGLGFALLGDTTDDFVGEWRSGGETDSVTLDIDRGFGGVWVEGSFEARVDGATCRGSIEETERINDQVTLTLDGRCDDGTSYSDDIEVRTVGDDTLVADDGTTFTRVGG